MRTAAALGLLLIASCGTPGMMLSPEPGDFAFLEIKLRG